LRGNGAVFEEHVSQPKRTLVEKPYSKLVGDGVGDVMVKKMKDKLVKDKLVKDKLVKDKLVNDVVSGIEKMELGGE
jgi:hypothetical protein